MCGSIRREGQAVISYREIRNRMDTKGVYDAIQRWKPEQVEEGLLRDAYQMAQESVSYLVDMLDELCSKDTES